jgi:imidazoleglycerol phosphate dehydratase HisB
LTIKAEGDIDVDAHHLIERYGNLPGETLKHLEVKRN